MSNEKSPARLPIAQVPTLVMIHGFLDNSMTWGPLVRELEKFGLDCITPDLRGAGIRADSGGPYTLLEGVNDVLQQVGDSRKDLIFLGHSMGAQIAELAAMRAADRTAALILMTPTPLEGNSLPDEIRTMLRESGGDAAAQKHIRQLFSCKPPQTTTGSNAEGMMGPEAVRGYYDAFTSGDPAGKEPSTYDGPTLLIGAKQDPVIPLDMVHQIRDRRFSNADLALVDESGHWPQVEQPVQVAQHLADFLRLQ